MSLNARGFQHTAARRRLEIIEIKIRIGAGFNTQPPEGGWDGIPDLKIPHEVSTHSRPKAAGSFVRYVPF